MLKKSAYGGTFSKTFDETPQFKSIHRENPLCTLKTEACGILGVGRLLGRPLLVFQQPARGQCSSKTPNLKSTTFPDGSSAISSRSSKVSSRPCRYSSRFKPSRLFSPE